ncbi:MAG: dynamin family protein [Burkholderiales bacterium]
MEMNTANFASRLEEEAARFRVWRDGLIHSITEYHNWLERTNQLDAQFSVRFYDLIESLKSGRLTLAFLAEYSRGKTELINALFFSGFKQRLLPSDIGRTTMCPTEIFHDPSEAPYVKLLPIETRFRDESIGHLKEMPIEWSKITLNVDSATDMRQAMMSLADSKKIFALEARMMGLLDDNNPDMVYNDNDKVEVPVWRYAMINYPHPLLTNGLSILDTPGLNAMGLEPELTLNVIPNAHAVLFLLGIDTGVTRSDMQVWEKHVPPSVTQRIAVLNKIDLMWDDLKPHDEIAQAIQRQTENTSMLLNIPGPRVLAVSAQKALVGKIRGDMPMIQMSGISRLESLLADEIIPSRRKIISDKVLHEIGTMMETTRQSIRTRLTSNRASALEVTELAGKSREVVTRLWNKISQDKDDYNASLQDYRLTRDSFAKEREWLLEALGQTKLEVALAASQTAINNSWTTMGLNQGMRSLLESMNNEFANIEAKSADMKILMQDAYDMFHEKYGFQQLTIPPLDMTMHKLRLKLLEQDTDVFCRDPVNIATPKNYLVKKFYASLVGEARKIFNTARDEVEKWSKVVPLPLETQIRDYKSQIQVRLENLSRINENSANMKLRLDKLKAEQGELAMQFQMIERLSKNLQTNAAQ